SKYTCDAGANPPSPPLSISGAPSDTKSFALIVTDPDVPRQLVSSGEFVHWVVFDIPPETATIAEGATIGRFGSNGAGQKSYAGPCPPPQYEPSTHRYIFNLYALDVVLPLSAGATKSDVENAMNGHTLATAQIIGTYKKK